MLGSPILFFINSHVNKTPEGEDMRKLSTLTSIAGIGAVLALMAACQTVATNDAELVASKKEFLLAQSGFKVITVTTPSSNRLSMDRRGTGLPAVKYQWETILRFSYGDEGQDLCRETKTIQRL